MPFDLTPLFSNVTPQLLILLGAIGAVSLIVGFVTESWGKALGTFVIVVALGAMILALSELEVISTWVRDTIFVKK